MNFLMPSVPPVASIRAWVVKKTLFGRGAGDLDEVRRVVAVAADDRAGDAGVAELLDDRADVVRHRRDVVEVRLPG